MGEFNLNYKFNSKLRPVMEDPSSVKSYISFLQDRLKKIKPDQAEAEKIQVKFLGEIGSYAKEVGNIELSIQCLEKSLSIINEKDFGLRFWAAHTLKYGDALRYKKDYLGAETAFRSVLELRVRHEEIAEYEDFAWQHLGKLKFDEGDMTTAVECLKKALELREKKGIKELLESTHYALQVIQFKSNNKKKY